MSAALDYHRATNVAADGTDEDMERTLETHPAPFKDYGNAERVPLERSVAGPVLRDGAAVVSTATHHGWPGERRVYGRAYSSAGGRYPVEAYVAAPEALYSFDALERALVPLRGGEDPRARLAEAAAAPELARAGAVIVLTGIHARTGWKYGERGYRHIWWDAGTMLANLLSLAAADDLDPRLYTAFVDSEVNELLGVDGTNEYALALLALGEQVRQIPPRDPPTDDAELPPEAGARFALAERLHEASSLADAVAVEAWRPERHRGEERKLDRDELVRAIRKRGSVREYSPVPLPRAALLELLDWAESDIPADAPPVVRELVAVAAVEGCRPGIYDARLSLLNDRPEEILRERIGYAAMDQDHPRLAAANVFQLANLEAVVRELGDRGYRWAQLEAGIRAGRIQIGAFMRGWGAAASTFFDEVVSQELGTSEAPLLMVALGRRD